MLKTIQELSYHFDYKKNSYTRGFFLVNVFFRNLANFYHLTDYEDLFWLKSKEFFEYILTGKMIHQNSLKQRKEIVIYAVGPDEEFFFEGQNARVLAKMIKWSNQTNTKIVKGMVAFRGNHDIVVGKARVLHSPKETNQMAENEILIVPMTNPAYIAAVRKAKAIVTEAKLKNSRVSKN